MEPRVQWGRHVTTNKYDTAGKYNNREASSGLSSEAAQRTEAQSAMRTRDRWCWGWEGSLLGAGNNI